MIDLDRIKTIITDLDGTLVELRIEYVHARKEAIKRLENTYSFPKGVFSIKNSLFQMQDISARFLQSVHHDSLIPEIKRELTDIADKFEMNAAKRTNPLPRVLISLKALKKLGIEMVLLTARGKKSADHVLSRFNMNDYFKHIFTRQSMFNIKEHPNHLLRALKNIKIETKKSIVIGDSVSDISCGKAINAKTVGVTTGISKPEQLAHIGADYIMESFPQLLELLRVDLKG